MTEYGEPVPGAHPGRHATDGTPTAPCDAWDFLVSYVHEDRVWGEWIAWELEATGRYRTHLEAWDSLAGTRRPHRLHDAVSRSSRTIAVLSEAYLRSDHVRAEWQAAWDADPSGVSRTLIPVRVRPCEPDGLLRGIRYIDLTGFGSDEAAARASLLADIEASLLGRRLRRAPGTRRAESAKSLESG